MIHVCFALYDKTGRYSKFTGTAMTSIFENTASEVTVHILHDNTLPADNCDKFIYIAGRYGQHVKFYNVEVLCADRIAEIKRMFPAANQMRYSIAMFYRFLIPKVFPPEVEKVIYLDSDVVVNLGIRELWRLELGDKPLAAANETAIDAARLKRSVAMKYLILQKLVAYDDYFNSGVLLMNLNFLRGDEASINRGLKFLSEHPQMAWPDQDVLNYLYAANYVKLSEKFDVFVDVERTKSAAVKPRRAIYHYAVEALTPNTGDSLNRLWMEYFMRTPFFDADTLGRLFAGFRQMQFGLKQLLLIMSTTLRDR
ncbi:MAG: glycosyltransferase family 8 protein [Selenomonadaceae bacterium]|nr:glycosyltransferase family 8 protein [Selenomonadaceae bacterium]